MKFVRAFFRWGFRLSLFLILLIVAVIGVIFWRPELVLNEKTIDYALTKTQVLREWSWNKLTIEHEWHAWNKRTFQGELGDFCFQYDQEAVNVKSCIDSFSWHIVVSWTLTGGLEVQAPDVLKLLISKIIVELKETKTAPVEVKEKTETDYLSYYELLWKKIIPNFEIEIGDIELINKGEVSHYDLRVNKDERKLYAQTQGFELLASKEKFSIFTPKKIKIPYDLKTKNPLYFNHIRLDGDFLSNALSLGLKATIETATFQATTMLYNSDLRRDILAKESLKKIIMASKATLRIQEVKSTVEKLFKPPYNILPAPLNGMEGGIALDLVGESLSESNKVNLHLATEVNMKGPNQNLHFVVNTDVPFDLEDYSMGAIGLGVDFNKVKILLPELSKTQLPPSLIPDSRFQNIEQQKEEAKKKAVKAEEKKPIDFNLRLHALGENTLIFSTNLLDEFLRLNFDIKVTNNGIEEGYVKVLPLTTSIFKRKIHVASLDVKFQETTEPQLDALIEFHLPEYLVKLVLSGPASQPRQAFSSEPPLPIDDIYAVLLFGRPLSGLDQNDKDAAKDSSKLISQGILSLAVLYYFAGSPIESIGYDPESNQITTQIGLGSKSSLRVGGSGSGLNSAGVRHSLGRGWYIDGSVQKSTRETSSGANDFGVLLERIISY